jgi:hypothetical protein
MPRYYCDSYWLCILFNVYLKIAITTYETETYEDKNDFQGF